MVSRKDHLNTTLNSSTIRVYLCMLKNGKPLGCREIMREMGFSSPSSAAYHLEKLRRSGLVQKDRFGLYYVSRIAKIKKLNAFLLFKGRLIPKHAIYASLLSIFLAIYVFSLFNAMSLTDFMALIPAIIASIILWYETAIDLRMDWS